MATATRAARAIHGRLVALREGLGYLTAGMAVLVGLTAQLDGLASPVIAAVVALMPALWLTLDEAADIFEKEG